MIIRVCGRNLSPRTTLETLLRCQQNPSQRCKLCPKHPVHLSHVHAFRRADRRYREVREEGFPFKNCVRPLMPSTVLYKVKINSSEICQFHITRDPKCFNLRYVSQNSQAPFLRYGTPDTPFLGKINYFVKIAYNWLKL